MNKILALSLVIFCHALPSFGQIADPDPDWWFSFYPLQVGNEWQYDVFDTASGREKAAKPFNKVLGDSLFSNGFRYFEVEYGPGNLSGFGEGTQWERVDSSALMVMQYNEERASLFGLPNNEVPLWPLPNGQLARTYWFSLAGGQLYSQVRCTWEGRRGIFNVDYPIWTCEEPWQRKVALAPTIGAVRFDILWEPVHYQSLRYISMPTFQQGVAVNNEAGWSQLSNNSTVVYPNPAVGVQTVFLDGVVLKPNDQVNLVDLLGRRWVPRVQFDGGTARVELPRELGSGVYYLQIRTSGTVSSTPFVFQSK